jgi:hypothetical protein
MPDRSEITPQLIVEPGRSEGAVGTVIFVRTETNPLIVVAAAAVLGYFGFV